MIVEGAPDGALQAAFQVSGYPSYCILRDGVIVSVAGRVPDLDAEVAQIPA